jgi:hypothetical protein
MAALATDGRPHSQLLLAESRFFEQAELGAGAEVDTRSGPPAARAPAVAAGSAALQVPSTPTRAIHSEGRRDAVPSDRRARRPPGHLGGLRLPVRRRLATAGTVALIAPALLGLSLVTTSRHPSGRSPAVLDLPDASPARLLRLQMPIDVVAPRLARLLALGASSSQSKQLRGVVKDSGSGVRRLDLLRDGRRLAGAHAHCRRGCPSHFRVDLPGRLRGGAQSLALVARDAAGNSALVWQRLVERRRYPAAGRLAVALVGRPRAGVSGFSAGERYGVAGRLSDPTGAPIPGARVGLLSLARSAAARPRLLVVRRTDRHGRWRVRSLRASAGSRTLVARTVDVPSGTSTVSRALTVTVAAPLRISVHRGATPIVTGRVTGLAGALGPRAILARHRQGRWRALTTARVRPRDGRFRLPLTVKPRSRLAVFVAGSSAWPFAPASRAIRRVSP